MNTHSDVPFIHPPPQINHINYFSQIVHIFAVGHFCNFIGFNPENSGMLVNDGDIITLCALVLEAELQNLPPHLCFVSTIGCATSACPLQGLKMPPACS